VFNFFITAYSLADWVQNDPAIPDAAKLDLSRLRESRALRVCRDLANSGKHLELDPRRNANPAVAATQHADAHNARGYGPVRDSMLIELREGGPVTVEKLVEDTLREWDAFFAVNDL
jgi:hypothetical protein